MKNVIKAIVFGAAAMSLAACQTTTSVAPTVVHSASSGIDGAVEIEVRGDRSSRVIAPRTYVCSAFKFPLDMSGVAKSLERSVYSSFSGHGEIYKVTIDIRNVDADIMFQQGYWSNHAEADVDIELNIQVERGGEILDSRSVYSTAESNTSAYGCQDGTVAMEDAFQDAIRKAVSQTTDFISSASRR